MYWTSRGRMAATIALAVLRAAGAAPCTAQVAPGAWTKVDLPPASRVWMGGRLGDALRRGVERLGRAPYTAPWLRADVSFETNRIFTNYSGDVSGRFIELASLTTPKDRHRPGTLDPVVAELPRLQKPDGHFGVDVDLQKPLVRGGAVITLLWGNARLLVGLVTAARELHNPALLACARRLGDFYVRSADQLCSPDRLAEYRSSGNYGDGYSCCYFPAIEGLVLLYRATGDARYLAQAQRMAAFFREFDALPVDHSHGNLCTWRGILDLYDVTHDRSLLDRAQAKWEAAVHGGFVWPVGGVGEHWYVSFTGDEGCSESDWLRFNLELWRHTGAARYLDMAERLLENQYVENQCETGGFGWRPFEADAAGPYATHGPVQEWNFCCSFHGPLGLYYLKSYLATGSAKSIRINFPYTFSAPVRAGGADWLVDVRTTPNWRAGACVSVVSAKPASAHRRPTALRMRMPVWAAGATVAAGAGRPNPARIEGDSILLARSLSGPARFTVRFRAPIHVEARRFVRLQPRPGQVTRLKDVTLTVGPEVLSLLPARGAGRPVLLALVDAAGNLDLPRAPDGEWRSVPLSSVDAGAAEIRSALASAQPVALASSVDQDRRRSAFALDLVVAPSSWLTPVARRRIAHAAQPAPRRGLVTGERLERTPEVWQAPDAWRFAADGLHVDGGGIGLIDGQGYSDYRFEFDMVIPREGEGIAGWVVRARDADDCILFQLQTADSTFHAPQYKTRPNTLRPHVRRNGAWTIDDPIPLPKPVLRGESHHIAVECRGARIAVFLDGERIREQGDAGCRTGGVGFRAEGAGEAGLYSNIALRRLP